MTVARRNEDQLVIWCLLRDQYAHVQPIERQLGQEARFVYDDKWDPDALVRQDPDLVLCVNDYQWQIARCLDAARARGIPSLVLQDGILEWRCQYENPQFGAGGGAPQHQPVLADKIACLGAQSARQLSRWGNARKVEVTGMPRLDHVLHRPVQSICRPGARVLVMTAKTPGFTPEQVATTLRSLTNLHAHLQTRQDVAVVWRISGVVARQMQVTNRFETTSSQELAELIQEVDAVITTPSTAMLEAMLLGRPVAALDYPNVPRFVPTAWTISAPEHIPDVVSELLAPPATKMAFQNDCLHDCLACVGPAASRVADLIKQMVALRGTSADQSGELPAEILNPVSVNTANQLSPLSDLYPDQPVFRETDTTALQVRVARLQADNRELRQRLARHGLGDRLFRMGQHLFNRIRPRANGTVSKS